MGRRNEKDAIFGVDDYLEKVPSKGEFISDLDTTPLMKFMEKYYSPKEANDRKEYFDDIIASGKDKKIRESIGTRALQELDSEEREVVEDIISNVIDYSNNSASLGIFSLLKSFVTGSNIFNLRDEDDEEYLKFKDLNNIISKDNLAQIVSTLDGIDYIKNLESDFENDILPDVQDIILSNDLKRDQIESLYQLIALAEFGCVAGRVLEKLSGAASKLAPDAKRDMADADDGVEKSRLDSSNRDKEKSFKEMRDDIDDIVDAINSEAIYDVDDRSIEDVLSNLSSSDFTIVANLIDGKYPVNIDQEAANGLNMAIEFIMSLDEDENSIETVDTQLALVYAIIMSMDRGDCDLDDVYDEYIKCLVLHEDDTKLIDRKITDSSIAEFALENDIGEFLLYRVISVPELNSQYESIVRETMCGRNPIISYDEIKDAVERFSRDGEECREKDITNIISDANLKTEFDTEAKSWFGDLIAGAYNALND